MANVYDVQTGKHLAAPYKIQTIKGVKIGFIGFTSAQAPQLAKNKIAKKVRFTNGEAEFKKYVTQLRPQVDLLVVLSELGLSRNIQLAKETAGVNFLFSSGMHEATQKEIVLKNGTVLMAEGQDGTRLGELNILIKQNKLLGYRFKMHTVSEKIPENKMIKALIAKVRAPFVDVKRAQTFVNPFNMHRLKGAITEVVGKTNVNLHRSNFSVFEMPAVLEGSSHDFITDAFRVYCDADIALFNGYRQGTHVRRGEVLREDLYHYLPVDSLLSRGEIYGKQIKDILEKSAQEVLSHDIKQRKGGWLVSASGLHYDLDPRASEGERCSNISVLEKTTQTYLPLQMDKLYTVASLTAGEESGFIEGIKAKKMQPVLNARGGAMSASEVIEAYLMEHDAAPQPNRIHLLKPLLPPTYTNQEVQPFF